MRYWPRLRWEQGKIVIGDRIWTRCGIVLDAQSGEIRIGNDVSINDYSVLLGAWWHHDRQQCPYCRPCGYRLV